eukprot:m.11199 g.11199  ORF g.11199 m.11199 type:complete len:323 (-) comp2828_c0_seq2:186-1154(-)
MYHAKTFSLWARLVPVMLFLVSFSVAFFFSFPLLCRWADDAAGTFAPRHLVCPLYHELSVNMLPVVMAWQQPCAMHNAGLPMGEKETTYQVEESLKQYNTDYIDLVLIHWPTSTGNSSDPQCQKNSGSYDAKACRLTTWKALLSLWKAKKIRAVGVSNFNMSHLQEIIDAGLELPAVNQCPFNSHLYSAQKELVKFCKVHNILFNSYSPLGIPDWHKYPSTISSTGILIEEPAIKAIGAAHKLSAAQTLLAWQWAQGIVFNPRSYNTTHMEENLSPSVFSTQLSASDLATLNGFKPDACTSSNKWYECCGDQTVQPSIPVCE